ncbi:MAG: flavin reductase family protein [Deltaproteobacteria bacterium]
MGLRRNGRTVAPPGKGVGMKDFRVRKPAEIKDNPFTAIGKRWMLIAAGSPERYNMMTASWGAFGVLWHRDVCFCFLRPQRYTREFVEKEAFFTLSFFDDRYKKVLNLCGSRSGRDIDKMMAAGLTAFAPLAARAGLRGRQDRHRAVAFREARLILVCRKIYHQDILPGNFVDPRIGDNYPQKDYHRMYVGEVMRCLTK